MKTFFKILSFLMCIVLLLPITSCKNNDDAYVYFQLDELPQTLDPQTAKSDVELLISQNLYEGLMRFDENGELQYGVAKSHKKQGLTYTFKLRDDAKWKNGDKLTAYDFEFGFKRALSFDTAAPYASLLYCIKNAREINSGDLINLELGVKALDDKTLKIELCYDNPDFLKILTLPISMPCNEEFFLSCKGKYGLDTDFTLSNGSYRLVKWGKEIFGIRLYRNKEYTGDFTAKNAAVFISHNKDLTAAETLLQNDADIAFVKSSDIDALKQGGIKTAGTQNTVWFLTLSDKLPLDIRKSLTILASSEIYSFTLSSGVSPANSIFPPSLNTSVGANGLPTYNLDTAKALFTSSIKQMPDKKLPDDIKLYYYDNGFSKNMVTAIVGHWQNHLGAFINIEAVSTPSVLESQLKSQDYYMSIFPVTVNSPSVAEYLSKFGIDYTSGDLTEIQTSLLSNSKLVPLAFESKTIAYSESLANVKLQNGTSLDFAFIVKTED
ncbi:MAG: hypothetical protein IJA44_00800 [Clostridia bacterium]|nr:hypothetical protein [Clostridia bacterium]